MEDVKKCATFIRWSLRHCQRFSIAKRSHKCHLAQTIHLTTWSNVSYLNYNKIRLKQLLNKISFNMHVWNIKFSGSQKLFVSKMWKGIKGEGRKWHKKKSFSFHSNIICVSVQSRLVTSTTTKLKTHLLLIDEWCFFCRNISVKILYKPWVLCQ